MVSIVNDKIAGIPNNSILVLDQSNDGIVMSTLSVSVVTLRTLKVPAGLMGPNDAIRINTMWTFLNNANVKHGYVDFGGSNLVVNENFATSGISSQLMQIVRAKNAVDAQKFWNNARCDDPYTKTTIAIGTSAINTSVDFEIRVRADSDGTDIVTCESVIIELLRAP